MKTSLPSRPLNPLWLVSIFLLSVSTLAFEINLTHLFSVSQFYHFAFMIVSLALLGIGMSGTIISIMPRLRSFDIEHTISICGISSAISMISAYLFINFIPFDSFSIAWDIKQVLVLALHYLILAIPFFFTGLAVGLIITIYPQNTNRIYAANLSGSGVGCVFALLSPVFFSGVGTVSLCSLIAFLSIIPLLITIIKKDPGRIFFIFLGISIIGTAFTLGDLSLRLSDRPRSIIPDIHISPYKGLSYSLQYPGAKIVYQEWNAVARVDRVESEGIRSLPGLSYTFIDPLPSESGLFINADRLTPIIENNSDLSFATFMPVSTVYPLLNNAKILIIEPKGGLDIIIAREMGSHDITVLEPNPAILNAAPEIYDHQNINIINESHRSYLRRTSDRYDLIIIALSDPYHPVRSGAYSLGEDYRYTVESIEEALNHLEQDGILFFTRWLQMPPSEFLRAFTTSISAMQSADLLPEQNLIAFRSYNTGSLLIKSTPFTSEEINNVKRSIHDLAFDIVFAPGLLPDETNRYNRLEKPFYFELFNQYLAADDQHLWLKNYEYDVSPIDDDHPFFGHYFRWLQTPQIISELGKIWQPFGGAGYYVLLLLLAVVLVITSVLILLPVVIMRNQNNLTRKLEAKIPHSRKVIHLTYFCAIGLAYLLVEIPLIQKFILYLGQPTYAITIVIFSLLVFSGVGSHFSENIPDKWALLILVILSFLYPAILTGLFKLTLGLNISLRFLISLLVLAPLGFLMGIPFPAGIQRLNQHPQSAIAWVWAVNGSSSVIASVVAAILALSFGFQWVLFAGTFCYLIAMIMLPKLSY